MLEEKIRVPAKVIKSKGKRIVVEVIGGACEKCPNKGKCVGELLTPKRRLELDGEGYREGDIVFLEEVPLSEGQLTLLYTLLFGVPFVFMLLGAWIFQRLWNQPFIGFLAGLGVGSLVLKVIDSFYRGGNVKVIGKLGEG